MFLPFNKKRFTFQIHQPAIRQIWFVIEAHFSFSYYRLFSVHRQDLPQPAAQYLHQREHFYCGLVHYQNFRDLYHLCLVYCGLVHFLNYLADHHVFLVHLRNFLGIEHFQAMLLLMLKQSAMPIAGALS